MFCLNSPKLKDTQITMIQNREKQQILPLEKLEHENVKMTESSSQFYFGHVLFLEAEKISNTDDILQGKL